MDKKMKREPTMRMLGCADYEARWVDDSQMVKLTARGFLPCANHQAQLEKGADGIWETVFYTQEDSVESYTPFCLQAFVMVDTNGASLFVKDALGVHKLAIQAAKVKASEEDTGSYIVYARKAAIDVPDETYFTQPVGTKVLPIYNRAFGPASKAHCAEFIATANDKFMIELDELHAKIEKVEGREE